MKKKFGAGTIEVYRVHSGRGDYDPSGRYYGAGLPVYDVIYEDDERDPYTGEMGRYAETSVRASSIKEAIEAARDELSRKLRIPKEQLHESRSAHHRPREEAAKNDYRVVVNGHVVYHGHNNRDALLIYHEHMRKIKAGHERGKAEVFKNGEMEREFVWGREHSRRTHEARRRRGPQNQKIEVWNPRQSEALPDREDAVDVDVSVGSIDGEATVVRGHQGFEPYGNAPDYWLSGNLLRTLQEELTDEQFTRVLREIASQAEEVAERWSRGQLRETPRHRPDKSFHFLVGRYYLIDKTTGAVLAGPFDSTEDAEKHQRRSRFDTYIWQNQHSGGRPPSPRRPAESDRRRISRPNRNRSSRR